MMSPAEMCGGGRHPQNISDPRKDSGPFVNENLRPYVVETLTNKANIITLTPKYMTLNDREWPFYVKFSLLRTALW